jgi:perosamine synthetase
VLLGHYERVKTLPENLARYARTGFGFKYRMSPLAAAIGRRQLARLDAMNGRRIANCERLARRLRPLGFETYDSTGERRRIYYEFVARLGPELARRTTVDALVERLRAEGARVNPGRYPLLHQQPFFTEKRMLEDDFPWRPVGREPSRVDFSRPLPESERVVSELISIPTFPGGSFELVDQYARAFEKVMEAI